MRIKKPAELEQLLGYQIQMAHLEFFANARDVLASFGVTPVRVTALLIVRTNPGCDQTALGRAMSINRSSAMKLVNSLEEVGLIERRAGRDLRTNALHLTEKGEAELAKMHQLLSASEAGMATALAPDERDTLIELLTKLRRSARGHAEKNIAF